MKMPALAGFALLLNCFLAAWHVAPYPAFAAPAGFELDLKELKKPSPTLIVPQKQTAPPKTAQGTAKVPAKKPSQAKKTTRQAKKPASTQPAPQATPQPQETAERVVALDGATACQLARQLLKAVALPLPAAEVLQGLTLPASAAGWHQGATVVVACGLPMDEAYTYGRMLEADGVKLINVAADEPAELTFVTIAEALGLSYRQLQDNPLSYLANDHQDRPVRLAIGSTSH